MRIALAIIVALGGAACLPFPEDARYRCATHDECNADERCGPRGVCEPRVAEVDAGHADAEPIADASGPADATPREDAGAPACGFVGNFAGPLDTAAWQLGGVAVHLPGDDGRVRLTATGQVDAAGAIMRRRRQRADTFSLELVFQTPAQGELLSDGLAVGWYDAPSSAIGRFGGGLGYEGLTGIAIEVDTYGNGPSEPTQPFIAVAQAHGPVAPPTILAQTPALPELRTAGPHTLVVEFARGRTRVHLDGAHVLTTTVPSYLPFDATFGATAGTGLYTADHDVFALRMSCGLDEGFVGGFRYRRPLSVTNGGVIDVAAGTTMVVPVPHAAWISSGRARPDGRDLAVYLGRTPLDAQWLDVADVGTDAAQLVVRLPVIVPRGTLAERLYLYSGDPSGGALRTDRVFALAERFHGGIPTGGAWSSTWSEVPCEGRAGDPRGSACVGDWGGAELTHRVLSLPRLPSLADAVYELALHVGGGMAEADDLLYLAEGRPPSFLPTAQYVEAAPGDTRAYAILGQSSTTTGWHRPLGTAWRRVRVRHAPPVGVRPSFVLGYLSRPPVDSGQTRVLIDDVTARRAAEPELEVVVGPEEERP